MNNEKSAKPHIIFDAIHHVMELSKELVSESEIKMIRDIIDRPDFQRMKGIKQLGLSDMVFPTATHTRFSHSLGTTYLAAKTLKTLNEKGFEVSAQNRFATILAALIHDIGHGPFSHSFEKFFERALPQLKKEKITHEDWTRQFLIDLSNNGPTGEYHHLVLDILFNNKNNNVDISFLNTVISSQLDCDRLDYLLRDSHFCGVSYGTYDLDWLLNCLTIVPVDKNTFTLGINEKGIGSVENFLLGRRLMYLNIYQNKHVIAFEDIMVSFLLLLMEWVEDYEPNTEIKTIVGRFLYEFMQEINECRNKGEKKQETISYLFDRYRLLTDVDIWYAVKNIYYSEKRKLIDVPNDLLELTHYLVERKKQKVFEIKARKHERLRQILRKHRLDDQPHKAQVITPDFSFYEPNQKETPEIYVLMRNNKVKKFTECSNLKRLLVSEKEERLFLRIDEVSYRDIENEIEKIKK